MREFQRQDQRDRQVAEALDSLYSSQTIAPEIGRELRFRDEAIQRLEKRVDELEKRR